MRKTPSTTSGFSRRDFIAGTGAAAAFSVPGFGSERPRPNILWIIAEDFSPDLACYGAPLIRTPHLDRLASEGVRFTHAYVTGPVCSASRSAIATGMYQTSINAHHHRSHRDDGYRLPENIPLFTHYLRQAGYHTSNVLTAAPGLKGAGKTDFNFNVDKPYDGTDWNQRASGQPFYAQVNFPETHRAFRRFPENPVDPAKVTLPPCYPDHPAVREDWAMYLDTAQHLDVKVGKVLDRLRSENLLEETIIFFFGDHGQPMPRGKQFLYEAGIRIPLIVRVPEKYRLAGVNPGSVRDDFVSAIDLTVTTLQLAGIKPPAHMQGQIFLGPGARKRDFIVAARDRCDETVDRIRCVRTARYKYIRNYYPDRPYTQPNVYKDTSYPTLTVMRQLQAEGKLSGPPAQFMAPTRPAEELYDLQADPHEVTNLAGSAAHARPLAELRSRLDEWIKKTGDMGEKPEIPIPAEYKYRAQVDGWTTQGNCLLTRSDGLMRVECSGNQNTIRRGFVCPGGDLTLRFRARSTAVKLQAVRWGAVTLVNSPKYRASLDFVADGTWREYTVPITVEGHLALLAFEIGAAEGALEFDWIRLQRQDQQPVKEWDFAG